MLCKHWCIYLGQYLNTRNNLLQNTIGYINVTYPKDIYNKKLNMKNVKLVAESFSEWEKQEMNEGLFDSPKQLLVKFVQNPDETKKLLAAYSRQISKVKGLDKALLGLEKEKQVELAKQSLAAFEKKKSAMYPWILIEDGKIVKGFAKGGSQDLTVGE